MLRSLTSIWPTIVGFGSAIPFHATPRRREQSYIAVYIIMIDLSKATGFGDEHRSGWSYVIDSLMPLHSEDGIFFDDFIERSHSWNAMYNYNHGIIPYNKPWVGIVHNPHNMPQWFGWGNSPQSILAREPFRQSLKHCKGLFTLSKYARDWWKPRVSVPVWDVYHPTETPDLKWTPKAYEQNEDKKIIQIGYWLRQIHAIQLLPTKMKKVWIVPKNPHAKKMQEVERCTMDLIMHRPENYVESPWRPDDVYDKILSRNITFVYLYDSSANNAVIECIVRNTPILVNRHPAVVEYLGPQYPLYYDSLEKAASLAESVESLVEGYEYLKRMDKTFLSADSFIESVRQSIKSIL